MLWSALESVSLAGVSFAVLVMLARYLDASTFGKAAIALGIVQIACSFVESFFHDAVVQRKALAPGDVDAAHTCGVLIGVALVLAIGANSAWAASTTSVGGAVEIARLALWMSPSIIAAGWCAMAIAQMRRNLAMRELALATAGSRLIAGVATLVALSQGLGVWALVVNQNLAALALLVLLRVVKAPGAHLSSDLSGAKRLARYAALNSVSGLINANLSRLFQLMCGFVMPAAVVGQISLALRMVEMLVSVMVTGVARVTMSRLAAALHAGTGVASGFLAATRKVCFVMAPVLVLMAVAAQPLVLFVGHEGWGQAATLVMWFALAQWLRSPVFLVNTLFSSLAKPQLNLLVSVVDIGTLVLLTWTLHSPFAWITRLLVVLPVVLVLLSRHAGIGPRNLLRAVHESFIAAAVMGAVLMPGLPALGWQHLPPLVALAVAGAAASAVYVAMVWLLTRQPHVDAVAGEPTTGAGELS